MFRRLRVLYHKIRSVGIMRAIVWIIITGYHRIIPQRQVIWCTDLTKIDSEEFSLPDNVVIQGFYSIDEVDKEDLKTLINCGTALMGSAANILIRKRFNKGAVLWLLKTNQQLAGYRWTISNNHVTPTYIPHTETDVHSIGTEIFPAFRGLDLYILFDQGTKIIFKNEGFKRFYYETYLWNKRAVKAILKTSSHKIGVATRFKIFGKNIIIWHDMSSKKLRLP